MYGGMTQTWKEKEDERVERILEGMLDIVARRSTMSDAEIAEAFEAIPRGTGQIERWEVDLMEAMLQGRESRNAGRYVMDRLAAVIERRKP